MPSKFFSIGIGQLVEYENRQYEVTHLLSTGYVLAKDIETLEAQRLKIDALRLPESECGGEKASRPPRDLSEYSDEEWAIAQKRHAIILPLLNEPHPTRALAERLAEEAGVSAATLYRWRDVYLKEGHLSALVPSKPGRKKGETFLSEEQEALIETAISEVYLTRQRHTPQDVILAVIESARKASIKAPHPNTVRLRINSLNPAEVLRKRGYSEEARNRFQPIQGEFPNATTPLAVVQVDHTQADVILVEETTRLPLGRPWITLAIDVNSRVALGLYVSFDHPSAVSVGMCMANALLPKAEYLAELNVPMDWPVWGKMGTVHVDNAKEFRGQMLKRACHDYGIDLQLRPVKVPHYGGHIERLMGTVANDLRKLPGATFSSPSKRKGYDSMAHSAMTLREFEQHLVEFLVNIYHRDVHSELNMPPLRKWELGIMGDGNTTGIGLPPIPVDSFKLRLDFMPYIERTVQPYGLSLDKINYYSEVLNPWINAVDPDSRRVKRKFIIRRDPRDISKVYFYDPEACQYFPIPYRQAGHPPMSLWELREAQKRLKAQGVAHVDEDAIFATLERMRQRISEAKTKTKAARRKLVRSPLSTEARQKAKLEGRAEPPIQPRPLAAVEEDIFADPPKAFEIEWRDS